jgi:glycerol dehydrogenase-like iron-containing ADH family enzyme
MVLARLILGMAWLSWASIGLAAKPDQAQIIEHKLRNFPLLKMGIRPERMPVNEVSEKPLVEIVAALLHEEPSALILSTRAIHERLAPIFPDHLAKIELNSFEEASRIASLPGFAERKLIIGIGAGAALDTAKAVAVNGQRLIVIPTLLSTNCHSSNRTVMGKGLEALSYLAGTPEKVIIPINEILALPAESLRYWTSAGIADYLAGVSARIDQFYRDNPTRLRGASLADLRRDQHTAEAFEAADWFESEFADYDRRALLKFDDYSNRTGFLDIRLSSNAYRIGSEHSFYHASNELFPSLRKHGPAHGHIVAWGSLFNAYAFGRYSGDLSLYRKLKRVMKKLGIPTDLAGIDRMGMTEIQILESLRAVPKPPFKDSVMGKYVLEFGAEALVRATLD